MNHSPAPVLMEAPLSIDGGITVHRPEVIVNGAAMDPFADDTPLTCGIENPEQCDSCT